MTTGCLIPGATTPGVHVASPTQIVTAHRNTRGARVLSEPPADVLDTRQTQLFSVRVDPGEHVVRDITDQHIAHRLMISIDIYTAKAPVAPVIPTCIRLPLGRADARLKAGPDVTEGVVVAEIGSGSLRFIVW